MGNFLEEIGSKVRIARRDMTFVEVVQREAIRNGLEDKTFKSDAKSIIQHMKLLNVLCKLVEDHLSTFPVNTDSNPFYLRKSDEVVANAKMLVVEMEKAVNNAKERRDLKGKFAKQSKNHEEKQKFIDGISKIINIKAGAAKTNVDNSKKAYTKAISSGLDDQEFKTATNQIMSQVRQTFNTVQNVQDRLKKTDFIQNRDEIEKMAAGALEHSKTELEQMRKAVSDAEKRKKTRTKK
ncbi:unnamed protein product [Cochlearia groenlandica]